jgi:pimeloyl-ACP methyl ester carboxylesterase
LVHEYEWKGCKVRYSTSGEQDAEPILLIHGFGASFRHYRKLIPELSKDYKVYAIDLLGFGSSDKPLLDYKMEIWQEQIVHFLEQVLYPGQQVHLVGNSIGSLASLMVSSSYPDKVRSVTLLNCAGGLNNKAVADDWRIKIAMPLFLLIDFLLKQPRIARYIFDSVRKKENLKNILLPIYPSNPAAVDDELIEILHRPSADHHALDVFVSTITGPPGPKPMDLIDKVQCPILVVWGGKDSLTPMDGPVGRYFKALPSIRNSSRFVTLPEVGHCPMDEAPEQVMEALVPFLEEVVSKDGINVE